MPTRRNAPVRSRSTKASSRKFRKHPTAPPATGYWRRHSTSTRRSIAALRPPQTRIDDPRYGRGAIPPIAPRPARHPPRQLFRRHLLRRRDVDRELAVTIPERLGIDLFELDRTAHDAPLPRVMFGIVLELRHHLFGEQFERFADVLVGVLAGLVEQDHLVDMGSAETPQFLGDGFRRSDQAAAQRRLLRFRIVALPLVVLVPHVDGAGVRALPVLRCAV